LQDRVPHGPILACGRGEQPEQHVKQRLAAGTAGAFDRQQPAFEMLPPLGEIRSRNRRPRAPMHGTISMNGLRDSASPPNAPRPKPEPCCDLAIVSVSPRGWSA